METKIDEVMKRTRRYWHEDGLGEIGVGGFFLLMGALLVAGRWGRPHSLFAGICAALLVALSLGGWFFLNRLIWRMKERITYPRTGYISPPRPGPRLRAIGIAGGFNAALLLAWLVSKGDVNQNWIPALQGAIAGGVLFLLGSTSGVKRLMLEGGAIIACGLALSLSGIDQMTVIGTTYLAAGAVMATGGGIALQSYLRSTRAPAGGDR